MPAAPSLLIVPYRSKTGKLYSQIPTSGAGDFTVTRSTIFTHCPLSFQDGETILPNSHQRGGGLHRYPQHRGTEVHICGAYRIRCVGHPPLGLLDQRWNGGVSCALGGACGDEFGVAE
jgi:hypothetical protein